MSEMFYFGTFEVDNERMEALFEKIENAISDIGDAYHELRNLNCIRFKKDPATLSSRDAD